MKRKKISTGLDKIAFRVLLETLKFWLITAVHALNRWSTDKMTTFINQYWWGNINKATKCSYLTCATCPNITQGTFYSAPRHFKLPNEPFNTKTPILWPPDAKSWIIWKHPDAVKDWGQEKERTTEDEMVGWHHRLDGHGFGWTLGVGDGYGGLACCGSWGRK